MKNKIWFLFMLAITFASSQDSEFTQDTVYFKYDSNGLHPYELTFYKDSLSAKEIYDTVKHSLAIADNVLIDYKGKITKEQLNQSFLLKATFSMALCHENLLGINCVDTKIDINYTFSRGRFTMKPQKIRRIVDIESLPLEGRAFFYNKDGSLKKQFLRYPIAIEKMLNWLAFFSSIEASETNVPQN